MKSFLKYLNIKLFNFHVNVLNLTITKDYITAFKRLTFPKNLKTLKNYIKTTSFLRHFILYYIKLIKPL